MLDGRKDVGMFAADLQDAIQNTRRLGFTATADAMADVLRSLGQVEAWRQLATDDLGFQDYGRNGDSSFQ
jgi:hypothetical protein